MPRVRLVELVALGPEDRLAIPEVLGRWELWVELDQLDHLDSLATLEGLDRQDPLDPLEEQVCSLGVIS